jgi:hypothetical protein
MPPTVQPGFASHWRRQFMVKTRLGLKSTKPTEPLEPFHEAKTARRHPLTHHGLSWINRHSPVAVPSGEAHNRSVAVAVTAVQ